MAEKERLPKKERLAQARAERKRKEEEARKQAQRKRMINTAATVGVLVVIAIIMIPTFQRFFGGDAEEQIEITVAAVTAARDASGCTVAAENQPQPEPYTHYEPAQAPPAESLYTLRPPHSGPHFLQPIAPVNGIPRNPIDERGSTHNLEHGAVIIWFDADRVDGNTQRAMESWQQERADQGFVSPRSGGAVFVSSMPNGVSSDKPIAVRAWGQALDCDDWDETYADGFLIDYYGTHGIAPERSLTPYPDGVLGYTDREVGDNTEAPTDDAENSGPIETPVDPSDMEPTEGGTQTTTEPAEPTASTS